MSNQQIADKVLAYHSDWIHNNEEDSFFNMFQQYNNLIKTQDLKLMQAVHRHVSADLLRGIHTIGMEKIGVWFTEQNGANEE